MSATIIRVADFDTGIIGLESAFVNIFVSGIEKEEELMTELLKEVKRLGNYISSSREDEYKKALLREYREYVAKAQRGPARRHQSI